MAKRISVVVSQGQSQNPRKRKLEEDLVTLLMMEPGVDVTVIPNLYDLSPEGTGILALQGISTDLIVFSWLFDRAARWTLDRNGIRGQVGVSPLNAVNDNDDDDDLPSDEPDDKPRVTDERDADTIPHRHIYCIELNASELVDDFVNEVRRIAAESSTQVVQLGAWLGGSPNPEAKQRFENPTNDTAVGMVKPSNGVPDNLQRVEESADRRWYPVIDFSRCTNCMECIDFCLFGVYGVDGADTILVEQPDNCRKGCPACSRVCPENAIIFPQHKSPAIAGAPSEVGALKIDLSRLFGAPDAVELAARERDEQLVMAGRDAVGMSVGIPKRQSKTAEQPKDELDELIDGLDELDF